MDELLFFEPPEDTPLGGCYAQLKDSRKRTKVFKVALENLVAMEELREIRGGEEDFQKTFSQVLEQAKFILKTI